MSTTASSAKSIFLESFSIAAPLNFSGARPPVPVEPKPPAPRAVSVEAVGGTPGDAGDGRDDHLGDAHATGDAERFGAEIDQDDLHLAAIIRVDGAGRVEDGDAVLMGESRPRAHLRLVPFGKRDRESGGDQRPRARRDLDIRALVERGDQIHARAMRGLIGRQGQALAMTETLNRNVHGSGDPATPRCILLRRQNAPFTLPSLSTRPRFWFASLCPISILLVSGQVSTSSSVTS